MSAYQEFGTVEEALAARRAGTLTRRHVSVGGWTIDLLQVERERERATAPPRQLPQWAIDGAARVKALAEREDMEAMERLGVTFEDDEPIVLGAMESASAEQLASGAKGMSTSTDQLDALYFALPRCPECGQVRK